jgi:flagellar protein FlgJ
MEPAPLPSPALRDPARAAPALGRAEAARLREAARDFEAILLQQLLKTMRRASPGGAVLSRGGTGGERLYRDLIDEQMAAALARGGGTGLADVLVRALQGPAGQKALKIPSPGTDKTLVGRPTPGGDTR